MKKKNMERVYIMREIAKVLTLDMCMILMRQNDYKCELPGRVKK